MLCGAMSIVHCAMVTFDPRFTGVELSFPTLQSITVFDQTGVLLR